MKQIMELCIAGLMILGGMPSAGAVTGTCSGSCSVMVSADVAANLTLDVTVTELLNQGTVIGPPVSAMDFSNLASNGTFDPDGTGPLPPQPRSLNSTRAYQVFFGVNAQQRPFSLTQTAGPLQSGPNNIKNGSFIVTPLVGVGGDPSKPLPIGTLVGTRGTAVATNKVLFSSTGGAANTMAATYGVTDSPALGATEFNPLDQPAGHYVTQVSFTLTIT